MTQAARPPSFWLSIAAVGVFAIWFALQGWSGVQMQTSLLDLLPEHERDQGQLDAIRRFADNNSNELLYLVSTRDPQHTRDAADAFANALRSSQAFDTIVFNIDTQTLEQLQNELGSRATLLSDKHRAWLQQGDVARLEREAQQAAFTPLGLARPFRLADDPLGLAADALVNSIATGAAMLEDDYFAVHRGEQRYALIRARVAGNPYALPVQNRVLAAIAAAGVASRKIDVGVQMLGSGVILFAAESARRARNEVTWFGFAGVLGIVLLLISVFRSPWPLLLTLCVLALATAAAIAVCQAIFGTVHILTLTFGTSLIGVAVDYTIHFFVQRLETPPPPPHELTAALLLGCGTTVAGYLALLAAPITALRQIALYSAVGLTVACAAVLLVLPHLHVNLRAAVPRWAERLNATYLSATTRTLVLVAAGAIAVAGLWHIEFRDDLRALQQPSPAIAAAERQVRQLLQAGFDTRFIVVVGGSEDAVLAQEEALRQRLDRLVQRGELKAYLAVTQSLPSLARQSENRALLTTQILGANGALARMLRTLGFSESEVERRILRFERSLQGNYLPQNWLASPLSQPWRPFWLRLGTGQFASIVMLRDLRNLSALQASIGDMPDIHFVDQVRSINALLLQYRETANKVLLAVALIVLLILLLRYRAANALWTAVPALGGVLLTVAMLSLLGQPLDLFNSLALLLVLGMGVDYAVFLREGGKAATMLGIGLASLTTLLSFGLLGFSSVPFVRTIGLTVALGIANALLLSLVLRYRTRS